MWTPLDQENARPRLRSAVEHAYFDFKQRYDQDDPATICEVAKDIAAFANHLGGTILVGAVEGRGESRGRAVAFYSTPIAATSGLVATASALCRPVPIVSTERIELELPALNELLARPSTEPVELVAINVPPMLSTPVGAPVCDGTGKRLSDAYRFPIRTVDRTRFLRPEELAFHMNTRERQILLQLEAIPPTERDPVTVWSYDMGTGLKPPRRTCAIVGLDAAHLIVSIEMRQKEGKPVLARTPLVYVRAVWHDTARWNVSVEGSMFTMKAGATSWAGFVPPGAMYDSET
jgi:hypothetical protein